MKEKTELILKLPVSTAECDIGPKIEITPGLVILKYDYEGSKGVEWITLRFNSAIAIRTTPDIAVSEIQLDAYSCVCKVINSEWLKSIREIAENGEGSLPDSLFHFIIYFDHYGAVEVVAKNVNIDKQVVRGGKP